MLDESAVGVGMVGAIPLGRPGEGWYPANPPALVGAGRSTLSATRLLLLPLFLSRYTVFIRLASHPMYYCSIIIKGESIYVLDYQTHH